MALSQEQIDALLGGPATEEAPASSSSSSSALPERLTAFMQDVASIAMEAGSEAVSQALGNEVIISNPSVNSVMLKDIQYSLPPNQILIKTGYVIGKDFDSLLLIKDYDVAVIFDILMGKGGRNPDLEIGDLQVSAIGEVMNQLVGAAATALSREFSHTVAMKPPSSSIVDLAESNSFPREYSNGPMVQLKFDFRIDGVLDSEIYEFRTLESANALMNAMSASIPDEPPPAPPPPSQPSYQEMAPPPPPPPPMMEPPPMQQQPMQQPMMQQQPMQQPMMQQQPMQQPMMQQPMMQQPMMQQQPMMEQQYMMQQQPMMGASPSIRPAQFSPLVAGQGVAGNAGLDMVLDIPLRVTVEMGSKKLRIKDVLELAKGYVVELDKLAGEPVDLLVNGKLIAKGEVVVINENFGLRITEIVGQAERISGLRA